MRKIAECLETIGNTSGRNDKIAYLEGYAGVEGFKEVLQFIFNPYIRTGIAAAKLNKGLVPDGESNYTYHDIIDHFTNYQTGSDTDVLLAKAFIAQFEKGTPERRVATAMVTKNLKIGVTAKTLNKVFGDTFIPMIGIMRAKHYDDYKDKVKGPFIVTEKLDGARRILVKEENGNATFYSRSGIPDEGLVDLEAEAKYLPNGAVYDGELLAIGEFDNAIELRQATNSIAGSKGKRTGLTFNVFDFISLEDFKAGKSKHEAKVRKTLTGALFGDESISALIPNQAVYEQAQMFKVDHDFKLIKSVPILGVAKNEDEVLAYAEPIWQSGFEGVMLNTFGGRYEVAKQVNTVLKVKNVEEHVLTVIDVELGRPGTVNEHRLGSLILDYKGYKVGCGSGISSDQRDKWWEKPELIVGRKVEVDCFGESTNKQGGLSLNCPVLKRVL